MILVADEVHEEDSLIYIEDYFGESPRSLQQNGKMSHENGNGSTSGNSSGSPIDDADMAVENGDEFFGNDVENGVESMDADHSVQSLDATGNSDDLFAEPEPPSDFKSKRKRVAEGSNGSRVDESGDISTERTVVKLVAGTIGPKEVTETGDARWERDWKEEREERTRCETKRHPEE